MLDREDQENFEFYFNAMRERHKVCIVQKWLLNNLPALILQLFVLRIKNQVKYFENILRVEIFITYEVLE